MSLMSRLSGLKLYLIVTFVVTAFVLVVASAAQALCDQECKDCSYYGTNGDTGCYHHGYFMSSMWFPVPTCESGRWVNGGNSANECKAAGGTLSTRSLRDCTTPCDGLGGSVEKAAGVLLGLTTMEDAFLCTPKVGGGSGS